MAVETGVALPVALVSEVMVLAVAIPPDAAPKAVDDRGNVATAVPGDPTEPANRNTKSPLVLISAVTALVAAFWAATEWVTVIGFYLLVWVNGRRFD